jgi:hypothetical protein
MKLIVWFISYGVDVKFFSCSMLMVLNILVHLIENGIKDL